MAIPTRHSTPSGATAPVGSASPSKGNNVVVPEVAIKPSAPGTAPHAQLSTNHAPTSIQSSPVRDMQSAIKDVSETIVSPIVTSIVGKRPDTNVAQNESFNDFINNHYLGASEDKDIMNNLASLSKTFKVDGQWGRLTNQALIDIFKIATSLLKIEGDLGLTNNIYQTDDLLQLKSEILTGYQAVKEQDVDAIKDHALKIVPHLKKINLMYHQLQREIMSKPEYRTALDNQPLDQYSEKGSQNTNELTPAELNLISLSNAKIYVTYSAPKQPGGKLDYLPLQVLLSKRAFVNWMLNTAGVSSESEAWQIFEGTIKPQIEQQH